MGPLCSELEEVRSLCSGAGIIDYLQDVSQNSANKLFKAFYSIKLMQM